MKKWSQYFQNPTYLDMTRRHLILDEYKPLIVKWCGIKDNISVLDVGCGTGYFSRVLGESGYNVKITGVDLDDTFIQCANDTVVGNERYKFMVANAKDLPFEDNSFDVVVSHTFFTSCDDPVKALNEMKRVCRSNGKIASVTAMDFSCFQSFSGHYPECCSWLCDYNKYKQKLFESYEKINPVKNYVPGISTAHIPWFFSKSGLKNVSVYPIGVFNSFSNATLDKKNRLQYIKDLMSSEKQKLDQYMDIPQFCEIFSKHDYEKYLSLLSQKCKFLEENIEDNSIWESNSWVNHLVVGENQESQWIFNFLK